ncbi:hypothetical protein AC578_6547 [Pseudocercospora eumusae]|uniref:Uncharacterized protein n=1 Tax=Pseudocercospora eumusae TaxID=321146 RepID=A0A139HHZ6_9PEZI|nr:hypothetical protein AC578_6547 [Pseudocercospora eumusae]
MEVQPPIVQYPSTGKHINQLAGEVENYARHLQQDWPDIVTPTSFPFIGTVKLRGTHADILQDEHGRIHCQSRDRLITPNNDHCGFAQFVAQNVDTITELFNRVSCRFVEMRLRERFPATTKMVMLSGEWLDQITQEGVASSQLQPAFVIFGIKFFHDRWESIQHYANIECRETRIYNVCRAGIWHARLSVEDNGAEFEADAMRYTGHVVDDCPLETIFGVSGQGEGLVWTPSVTSAMPNQEKFWVVTENANARSGNETEGDVEVEGAGMDVANPQ